MSKQHIFFKMWLSFVNLVLTSVKMSVSLYFWKLGYFEAHKSNEAMSLNACNSLNYAPDPVPVIGSFTQHHAAVLNKW